MTNYSLIKQDYCCLFEQHSSSMWFTGSLDFVGGLLITVAIYQVLCVGYFWAGCHCYYQRTTL